MFIIYLYISTFISPSQASLTASSPGAWPLTLSEESARLGVPRKSQPLGEGRPMQPRVPHFARPWSLASRETLLGRLLHVGREKQSPRLEEVLAPGDASSACSVTPRPTCFSVRSGLLRLPAGQHPPPERARLVAETVSPTARKPGQRPPRQRGEN